MDFFADALITMDFNYYLLMRKFEKFKRRLDETLKAQTSGYILFIKRQRFVVWPCYGNGVEQQSH